MINEILPTPNQGSDWVELYNSTNQDINLDGWVLDDEGTQTNMFEIKQATISAQGFLVFEVGSRLNKTSDTIYLKNNLGLTVDEYRYNEDLGSDISFGRMPDGGDWGVCQSLTKGEQNICLLPTPTPTSILTPTLTLTPEPTETPMPTLTPTPRPFTPTPTVRISTPTPKPTTKVASSSGEVLGEEVATLSAFYPYEATNGAEEKETTISAKSKLWPKFFLGVGLLLVFASAFWGWYNFHK